MNPTDPDNTALDALFVRSLKHPEVRVELCREMLEAELFTLIPPGPVDGAEEGEMMRMEAGQIPFKLWTQHGKAHFFVYTSEAMARRGMRQFKDASGKPLVAISMEGRQMLTLMSRPGVGIALNPGGGYGDFTFNDAVLTGMLDGTMFSPPPPQERVQGRMQALRPGQYPLSVVQPVFDYLKTRPEVHAAWVLEMLSARERGEKGYVFALLTSVDEPQELHDAVGTVLAMVNRDDRQGMEFGVTSFDIGNAAHVQIMRTYVPFYAAPGYQPAAPAAGE